MTTNSVLEALEWFIEYDETNDVPHNGFWINGFEKARKAVADAKGEPYAPFHWNNWTPDWENRGE